MRQVYRTILLLPLLFVMVGSIRASESRAAQTVSLTTLEGKTIQAEMVNLSRDRVDIVQDGNQESIALSGLLRIESQNPDKVDDLAGQQLRLTDGSLLPISEVKVADRRATVVSPALGSTVEISAENISWFYFRPALPEATAYVESVLQEGLLGDAIVVQKGDPPQFDHLSGVLGDVDGETVTFKWEDDDIVVKRKKLAAVIYYHPELADTQPGCWLETTSGARLQANHFELNQETNAIDLVLQCGIKLSIPFSSLQSIDLSAGKLVYLSDLQPLLQEWRPLVGLPNTGSLSSYGLPRNDRSLAGSPLSLRWPQVGSSTGEMRYYGKGVALRSGTEIEYRIPRGHKFFHALAGIDPSTAEEGHVRMEISADKAILWEGEISGKQPPVEINLRLPKARQLRFIVDYGENGDYGDRLHLIEARMTK